MQRRVLCNSKYQAGQVFFQRPLSASSRGGTSGSGASFLVNEFGDSPLQFVPGSAECLKLLFCGGRCNRVIDAPMNSFDGTRKYRTVLVGVIADRNHIVKLIMDELTDGLR